MQLSFFAMIWMRTVGRPLRYVHQIIWPLINNQYFMVSPSASTHHLHTMGSCHFVDGLVVGVVGASSTMPLYKLGFVFHETCSMKK